MRGETLRTYSRGTTKTGRLNVAAPFSVSLDRVAAINRRSAASRERAFVEGAEHVDQIAHLVVRELRV